MAQDQDASELRVVADEEARCVDPRGVEAAIFRVYEHGSLLQGELLVEHNPVMDNTRLANAYR
jgi:hypothetical protein